MTEEPAKPAIRTVDARIEIPFARIEAFCQHWKIQEFSLFGSVLREDFRPDSDVDVLISLKEHCGLCLWDLAAMADELEQIFGRKVDLAIQEALRNPFRRREILRTKETVYAA